MTLYVALCYYDREQPWDSVPDMEATSEYTEFARRTECARRDASMPSAPGLPRPPRRSAEGRPATETGVTMRVLVDPRPA